MDFVMESEDKGTLTLKGELTIARAKKIQEFLVTTLQQPMDLVIRLSEVTNLDIACIQILFSVIEKVVSTGHQVFVEAEKNDVVLRNLELAGFRKKLRC